MLICTIAIGILSGCGDSNNKDKRDNSNDSSINLDDETDSSESEDTGSGNKDELPEVDFSKTDEDMFTKRDMATDYDKNESIIIELKGSDVAASSDSVKISGTTITITEDKTHIISGKLDDGMIIVDAEETAKIQLVFEGVNINSATSAALYVKEADKVFVTLAEGTDNTLSNGGEFKTIDDNNIDAVLFSKQDLTINGLGKLIVTSPNGSGIVSKDDLVITSGDYEISSASHALDGNDSIRVKEADLLINAGKDGIHSENTDDLSLGFVYIKSGTFDIEAEGDGISAGAYLQIEGGDIDVLAGGGSENGTKEHSGNWGNFGGGKPGGMERPRDSGGPMGKTTATTKETTTTATNDSMMTKEDSSSSMKGLKSANSMLITGGKININSADDSVHSNLSITINGGEFELASGDDAVHAEESLIITEGKINITESYEGLEALNIDVRGGDIKLVASDDGLNAAGGTDSSGTAGGRDGMFSGGNPAEMQGEMKGVMPGGGMHGGMSGNSNGSIKISGGNLYINASGDGIDANGTIEISGGHTTVVGPTQGDTATLDYDVSGVITGGTFVGTGASNMAQSFSDSEQGVIALSVGNQTEGTNIKLVDDSGNILIDYEPELSYQIVILSTPDMKSGEMYTVYIGSESEKFEAS